MQYFHAKLTVCEHWCFIGKKVLSFIIQVLSLELQANDCAFKCCMADELYSGLLDDFNNYQETIMQGPDLKRHFQGKVQAH